MGKGIITTRNFPDECRTAVIVKESISKRCKILADITDLTTRYDQL